MCMDDMSSLEPVDGERRDDEPTDREMLWYMKERIKLEAQQINNNDK